MDAQIAAVNSDILKQTRFIHECERDVNEASAKLQSASKALIELEGRYKALLNLRHTPPSNVSKKPKVKKAKK